MNPSDLGELTLIGHFGGGTRSLFVRGPILYAGFGPEFAALDVSVPERPTRVGYVVLEGSVTDIQVVDSFAYVAVSREKAPWGDRGAIYVLDVTNPTNIRIVSSIVTSREPYEIAVSGKHVLATAEDEGLLLVDMTDASHPRLSSSLPPPPLEGHGQSLREFVGHVAVEGSFACITGVDLDILDISQPQTPRRLGHIEARELHGSGHLEIHNRRAFRCTGRTHGRVDMEWVLEVIDISDPASPHEIAVYHSNEDALIQNLTLDNNLAFVVSFGEDGTAGSLRILDVSSPTQPVEKGRLDGPAWCVAAKQPFVYLARDRGVDILDISQVSAPTTTGRYLAPDVVDSVVLRGQFAYIAGGIGLFIANISDPENVFGVGSFVSSDLRPVHNLAVAGRYAYLAEGQRAVDDFDYQGMGGGVQIVDISSLSNPRPLAFLAFPDDGTARDIEMVGNTAFVLWDTFEYETHEWARSLLQIDISDPVFPKLVQTQPVHKGVSEIEMSGVPLHIREEALELAQPARETIDSSNRSVKIHGPDEFAEADGVIYRTGDGLSLYRRR